MRNMSEPIIICGDGRISRTGLEDRSRRAAGLFAAAGIGAGSSVAVLLPNRIAFIEAMLGAQHIGAYVVPINWHFAPAEIAYILDDCGTPVLVPEQLGSVPGRERVGHYV